MTYLNIKQVKETLTRNEDRIILSIGFILVAILSFGAGKLSQIEHTQTPIVFQDSPNCQDKQNISQSSSLENKQNDAETSGKIMGNKKSLIYHMPGDAFYDKISPENRVYFSSEEEARKAGYRRAKK